MHILFQTQLGQSGVLGKFLVGQFNFGAVPLCWNTVWHGCCDWAACTHPARVETGSWRDYVLTPHLDQFKSLKTTLCSFSTFKWWVLKSPHDSFTYAEKGTAAKDAVHPWYRSMWLVPARTGQACSHERLLGRQPKLFNPIPGQRDAMCQWQGCRSLCYNSANDFIFG